MARRRLEALLVDNGRICGLLLASGEQRVVMLDEVVADLRARRRRYWLVIDDRPVPVELTNGDDPVYACLIARVNGDPRNRLADLPRHERSLWQEADEIVPLRPRPLRIANWTGSERTLVITSLALLVAAAAFLLRPISWGTIGGQQSLPGVIVIPRLYIFFVPIAMAVASFIMMYCLMRISTWPRILGIIGIALLAIEAGARTRIDAIGLYAGRVASIPLSAINAAQHLADYGLIAELLAIAAGLIAVRAPPGRSWRQIVAPLGMAIAFILPLAGYVASLTLPLMVAKSLYLSYPVSPIAWSPASSMASAVFEAYDGLMYLVVALSAWQAITFGQATGEVGPRVAHLMHRIPKVFLLLMSGLVLALDVAGYSHHLPANFGGEAAFWTLGPNSWVWLVALFAVVPTAFLLLRRIRRQDALHLSIGPVVLIAAFISLTGPVQIVDQTLVFFGQSFGIPLSTGGYL